MEIKVKQILGSATASPMNDGDRVIIEAIMRDKALVIAFLKRSDRDRFGALLDILEHQYSLGVDQYPTNLHVALTTLECYVPIMTTQPRRPRVPSEGPDNNGIETSFVHAGALVPGTNSVTHDGITCYNCRDKGHYAEKFPGEHVQLVQLGGIVTGDGYIIKSD